MGSLALAYRMTVVSAYRTLLSVPGARRLLVSAVVGRMPLGMSSLAILLLVRAHTGSFAIAGASVGAFALAGAAAAPMQGALVDRLGQPRVLLPCAALQSSLLLLLVAGAQWRLPGGALIVLAGLAGAFLPPISACARALWSEVAPGAAVREAAYALDAITQELIWILGPIVVGVVAGVVSSAAALVVSAAVTAGGTVLFAAAPLARRWQASSRARGSALVSSGLRALLVSVALTGVALGAGEVGLPALAVHAGSRRAAGLLLALWSLGSLMGGLAYGARRWGPSVSARYGRLLLLVGLSIAPLVVVHSLGPAIGLSVLAGLAIAPLLSCQYSLVGALAPAGGVTEAFTWNAAGLVGGIAAGSALAGWLVDGPGVSAPFALGCAAAASAGALALLGRRRLEPGDTKSPVRPDSADAAHPAPPVRPDSADAAHPAPAARPDSADAAHPAPAARPDPAGSAPAGQDREEVAVVRREVPVGGAGHSRQ
jgi:MFS family permease